MEGEAIVSSLRDISDGCASLTFELAGSVSIALAKRCQSNEYNTDAAFLIPALCAAAASVTSAGPTAPTDGRLLWTIASALGASLKFADAASIAQFIDKIIDTAYLPLLMSESRLEAGQTEQILAAAVEAIVQADAWPKALNLLKTWCLVQQNGSSNTNLSCPGIISLCAGLLEAAVDVSDPGQHAVLCCASDEVFPAALSLLTTSTTRKPTPAIAATGQSLLPAALAAAQRARRMAACLGLLWQTCSLLGCSDVPSDCRTGLALLVQFSRPLLQHGGISKDPALWSLLLRALGSEQGLNRKRALHVLELAVAQLQEDGATDASRISAWVAFIKLYTTVNDTSLHLFKEAWPQVDRLHLPAAEFNDKPGFNDLDNVVKLPVEWVLLLWRMAMNHRHVGAQKIAALSFLQRAWPAALLAELPPSFAVQVLLPVMGQSVLQRGELSDEIQNAVPRFFQSWSASLPMAKRGELLLGLLSAMAGIQQQQSAITFAAKALVAATDQDSASTLLDANLQAALLHGAAAAASAQPGYGANSVAMKVYVALIQAASSSVRIESADTLALVAKWLSAVPLPLLQPGGLVHDPLVEWLRGPQHATLFSLLEELLAKYVRSVDKVGAVGGGKEENGALFSTSPKELAVAALVVGEAAGEQAESMLRAVFATWSESFDEGEASSAGLDSRLSLLSALITACTALPGVSPAAPSSALQRWLGDILKMGAGRLIASADRHAAWLVNLIPRSCLEELGNQIDANCAAIGTSPETAFNKDTVLPPTYLHLRNTACDALVCIAGAAQLLKTIGTPAQQLVVKGYVACATRFIVACSTSYPSLFDEYPPATSTSNANTSPAAAAVSSVGGSSTTAQRARLEVAIALLRPLVACTHTAPFFASQEDTSAAMSLIGTLLAALASVGVQEVKGPSKDPVKKKKKKRNSVKLEPLTLHSWNNLLTWRSVDGLLGAMPCETLPVVLQAQVFTAAVVGLATAPEGSNALIPYIRCLRTILPAFVQNSKAMVPAILEAVSSSSSTQQQAATVLPAAATLDAVLTWMGDALIFALSVHTRKRTGMAAAVLSCCLHPCLFSVQGQCNDTILSLHQKGGAVRVLLQNLKEAADRHSRMFVLFSMQFAALLAAYPELGLCYADFVVELVRTGFEDDANLQSLGDVVLDEPTAAELAALLEPLDLELSKAHTASYAAPRVGTLCLLYAWVLGAAQGEAPAAAAAREVWSRLLDLALTDPELSTGRYIYNGPTHRKKIRVWQALTVLCRAVPVASSAEVLTQMMDAMDVSNAATVKQYQEIVALQMVLKQPELLESAVLPRVGDYSQQRYEAVPSLLTVATVAVVSTTQKQRSGSEEAHRGVVRRVLSAILPWAGSFVHGNRTFAQLVVWRLGELHPWLAAADPSYAAFSKFFELNIDLQRLRAAMGVLEGLDKFNLAKATSPRGVLCEESYLLGTSHTGGPLEGAPQPLMETLEEYLKQERAALRGDLAATMAQAALQDEKRRSASAGAAPEAAPLSAEAGSTLELLSKSAAAPISQAPALGEIYQRKITPSDKEAAVIDPWGAALGLTALSAQPQIDAFESDFLRRAVDEAAATAQTQNRQELIVVASLLDKLPNLAGLARTCEVFRASRLVMADVSITKDPQFATISVSAEHWVPLEEVAPAALDPWLRRKAAEGYALVGLEQTAESTRLQEFKFGEKTVLLLGAEKEGVPADLLQLLDATVEIPQLGVVRSLNVHVSAAIGIYEFTRQKLENAVAGAAQSDG